MSWRSTWHRWLALAFACCLMIGSYMSYDYPQNLENQLESDDEGGLNLSKGQVNQLYSVYSFPNIGLPLVGGLLIDAIGIRKGIFLFALILVVGQAVCAISVMGSVKSYGLMVAGRVIFGLGGENMTVAQSAIVSQWFKGKEISLALGLNISVSRVGSILSSLLLPVLYNSTGGLFVPLLAGVIACVFSWVCGIGLNVMDRTADKQEGKEEVKLSEEDKINFSDIKSLKLEFWLVCFSCMFTYVNVFPFMQSLQNYLIDQYGLDSDTAANYLSIPYFISAILTPIAGRIADQIGRRGLMLILSTIVMLIGHISFLLMPQCGNEDDPTCVSYWFLFPLSLLGIFYSIYGAVLWPCVPLVCQPKIVGTAFGIVNSVQNAGLAIAPYITAAIIDGTTRQHGYFYNQIFFICMSVFCIALNVFIYTNDLKNGGSLNRPVGKKSEEESESDPLLQEESQPIQSISAKRSFRS